MFNTKILVVVVAVVIIVGGGLLSTQTWNPSWNPFEESVSADKIVESSIAKLLNSKSFRAEADLIADVSADTLQGTQKGKVTIEFKADVDLTDREDIRNIADIDIALSAEGMEFSASLQTITTADGLYFNLRNIPAFLPLPIDLNAIKGQWFGLEKDLIKDILIGSEGIEADNGEQSEQFIKELLGILSDKEIFSVEKLLGTEKVGNEDAKHYSISLRKEAVKEIVPELFELIKKYIPEEQMAEYQQEIEQGLNDFPQKVDLVWQEMGGIKFEVWIGDGILRKIQWQKNIDLSDVQDLTAEVSSGNVSILMEIVFSNFGKKLDIKPPADYRPFEEILTLLGSSFIDPASTGSLDFVSEITE